jgi:hypothetical protein
MYMMTAKRWTVASARQHLPTLIRSAAREPQEVYRRSTLVATVVEPGAASTSRPTLAGKLAELQRICSKTGYELPVAARRDRPNPFAPARRRRAKP